MLFSYVKDIKCDFVTEPAKLISPFVEIDGILLFSIADIGAMKMHTVCGRGKKKDFFDIYVLTQLYGWEQLLKWFEQKYGTDQFYFLWRSITYFEDADEDADIDGLPPYSKSWNEIKLYIKEHCK
jgi:predicted nucleotidyltransferase component of viral defense system